MQRSDRWTGDGKLTVIKCLARWSEQWVQLIHSRWRQLRFGLGALGGWIEGLGTGLDVWVAGSDVSVAGLELAVAGSDVSMAGSAVWALDWTSGWLGRTSRWLDRSSRWLVRIGGCVLSVFFVTFVFLFSRSLCVAVRGEWPGNELKWKWVRKFISGSNG